MGRWRAVVVVSGLLALAGCAATGPGTVVGPPPDTPSTTSAEPRAEPSPESSLLPSPEPSEPVGVSKVLVVVEENHSLDQLRAGMPYLASLAEEYGYATAYRAVSHPSLPNYLVMAGGSTFAVADDAGPGTHALSGESVFGQARSSGGTARIYAESMPSPCALRDAGQYAVRHVPWAYFVDERAACEQEVVPAGTPTAGALAADIAAGTLPTVGMLVPDLDHDGHDGSLAGADTWLEEWLTTVLAGPDFAAGDLAVVVTADEDEGTGDDPVLTVVIAPGVRGQVVSAPLDHYALSALLSEVAGAAPLRDARGAPSMADAFGLRLAGHRDGS